MDVGRVSVSGGYEACKEGRGIVRIYVRQERKLEAEAEKAELA